MAVWIGQYPTTFSLTRAGPAYEGFRVPGMPDDGWITAINVAYDTWGHGSILGSFGLHGDQGQVLYASPQVTFANTGSTPPSFNRATTKTHFLSTPLRVTAGQQIFAGVGHAEEMAFIGDTPNMTPGGSNWYRFVANNSHMVPTDIIPGTESYNPQIQVQVLFEAQLVPTKPAWISPTPAQNGTTTDPSPELRFSIPHADGDTTKTVDIELTVLNTGNYWHYFYPVTSFQNQNGYYSVSPLTFGPGDQISVRARHQDTWDDWSEWSDNRVFTIRDDAPGVGAWQNPTPTEASLVTTSTPSIKGTTPHPGPDAAYDQTNGVQVQVVDADTNVVIQDFIIAPTPSDQAADVFNHTLAAIAQNTNAKIRFRHHDRKGTWSEWSDYRTFTMSAGPDLPTIAQPKGKVNYRNQSEYQQQGGSGDLYRGSYNNISGTIMHSVRVQLWNGDGTALLNDSGWVARTATAGVWTLPQASFAGHPTALAYGTAYKIRANVAESNAGVRGIESGWGPFVDLQTNAFPNRPSALSPDNGKPSATGQFSASVEDPDGDIITAAAMTIKNVATNATISPAARAANIAYALGAEVTQVGFSGRARATNAGRSAGTTTISGLPAFSTSIPNEGNTVKEIPTTAIARSTAYVVGDCRLRPGQTTADTWFMRCTTAGTTSVTNPGYTSPVDGGTVTDGGAVFTYRVPITWQNAGPSSEWSMQVSGNSLSKTFDTSLLTLGTEYQWYCRARDETGWGQTSFTEPFVYASLPEVTMLAPSASARTNLVRDPSAEYDNAINEPAPYWTVLSATTDNFIERSQDDSLYGDLSWKATATATNDLTLQGEIHTIDITRPYLLQAEFKKLSGTSNMRLRIRCLQADGTTFISNVTPTSILSGGGVNVGTTWTRYGGIIWPNGSGNSPAWPSPTSGSQLKVQIEVKPSDDAVAVVFFDGVSFEQLPTTVWTTGQWAEVQKWFGYFDGDTPSHTSRTQEYYWQGTQGISASQGDARLTSPTGKAYFRFNHNANMQDRRLLVDHWSDAGNVYRQIHDSGFIALTATPGSIVSVDMPPAVIRNDDRYRFRVQARDVLGISGEGAGTISDTDYIGQPEVLISSITSDATKAEVSLEWQATTLTDETFAGYEIARARREDPAALYTVLYREMNRASTRFTDPYPLSDVDYIYMVRTVQLIGVEEQQGRWGKAPMNVNYFPVSFVKDTEDPFNLYVAYETPLASMPTPEEDALSQMLIPWGQNKPTILTRADMRLRSGSVTANFYKDNAFVEEAMTRFMTMIEILERRQGICLLLQEPRKRRLFASVIGPWRELFLGVDQRGIEFDYHENGYEEDLRDREFLG